MKLWDKIQEKLGRTRDLIEVMEEDKDGEPIFIPNRAMRRAAVRASRKRGSGWTRPMKGGRESDA